jgi:hypothetical protein
MRTTIDLQDSLDRELRSRAHALGISYKEAMTRVVRAGLSVLAEQPPPYKVRAKACGMKPGFDWNHLNRLADELEDEGR